VNANAVVKEETIRKSLLLDEVNIEKGGKTWMLRKRRIVENY